MIYPWVLLGAASIFKQVFEFCLDEGVYTLFHGKELDNVHVLADKIWPQGGSWPFSSKPGMVLIHNFLEICKIWRLEFKKKKKSYDQVLQFSFLGDLILNWSTLFASKCHSNLLDHCPVTCPIKIPSLINGYFSVFCLYALRFSVFLTKKTHHCRLQSNQRSMGFWYLNAADY